MPSPVESRRSESSPSPHVSSPSPSPSPDVKDSSPSPSPARSGLESDSSPSPRTRVPISAFLYTMVSHKCIECSLVTKRSDNLKRHMKNVHGTAKKTVVPIKSTNAVRH